MDGRRATGADLAEKYPDEKVALSLRLRWTHDCTSRLQPQLIAAVAVGSLYSSIVGYIQVRHRMNTENAVGDEGVECRKSHWCVCVCVCVR